MEVSTDGPSTPKRPASEEDGVVEQLKLLRPYAEKLREAVKCAICLECIENAQQLVCGHVFCGNCVKSSFKLMKTPRCGVCNKEMTRRNVREAPINYSLIVEKLRAIEDIIDAHVPTSTPVKAKSIKDGFSSQTEAEVTRRRELVARGDTSPPPPSSIPPRICALCPSTEVLPPNGMSVPKRGRMVPIAGSTENGTIVHEACGDFANDCFELDGTFYEVRTALKNSRHVYCSYGPCKAAHATAQCAVDGCNRTYHHACAIYDGSNLIEDGFKLYCPLHVNEAPAIDDCAPLAEIADPDNRHENTCFMCNIGGVLVMCDFCDRSVHQACANLRTVPSGSYKCPVCEAKDEEEDEYDDGNESIQSTSPARAKHKKGRRPRKSKVPISNKRARRISPVSDAELPSFTQSPRSKIVLGLTGLNESEKEIASGIASAKRTSIRADFDKRISYMVCNAMNPTDTPTRTFKLCKAVAAGTTIVCHKWISDNIGTAGPWIDVAPYKHSLTSDGKLFTNMRFYFGNLGKMNQNKQDLITIVKLGGGVVLSIEPSINMTQTSMKLYLVEAKSKSKSNSKRSGRRGSLGHLADAIPDAEVVEPTWILDRCTLRDN